MSECRVKISTHIFRLKINRGKSEKTRMEKLTVSPFALHFDSWRNSWKFSQTERVESVELKINQLQAKKVKNSAWETFIFYKYLEFSARGVKIKWNTTPVRFEWTQYSRKRIAHKKVCFLNTIKSSPLFGVSEKCKRNFFSRWRKAKPRQERKVFLKKEREKEAKKLFSDFSSPRKLFSTFRLRRERGASFNG